MYKRQDYGERTYEVSSVTTNHGRKDKGPKCNKEWPYLSSLVKKVRGKGMNALIGELKLQDRTQPGLFTRSMET